MFRRQRVSFCRDLSSRDLSSASIVRVLAASKRLVLVVGGFRHEVLWSTLARFPGSRLGRLRSCRTREQILGLCDGFNLDSNPIEFYFDRHPSSFASVINFYRTGKLHLLEEICSYSFGDDLEYWNIDELDLEFCCQQKYSQTRDRLAEQLHRQAAISVSREDQGSFVYGFLPMWRRRAWNLMEKSQSSIPARIMAVISMLFIAISTICLTINTLPSVQRPDKPRPSNATTLYGEDEDGERDPFAVIEAVCVSWFSFEYLVRLWAAPSKSSFFKSPLNFIDLLAITPYYASLVVDEMNLGDPGDFNDVKCVLQIFRVTRVFRILKLARHSIGLQSLGYTLQQSYKELGLLVLFLAIGVLIFSSLAYFAEKDEEDTDYVSIPDTFWWAVITMTTVGFGDVCPKTAWGKLIGATCCVSGVLVVALPIPIIVSNFGQYYRDRLRNEELQRKQNAEKEPNDGQS